MHLPLGILTLAVALEILVRFRPFRFLQDALAPAWIAGAVSALASVALGLMHATEVRTALRTCQPWTPTVGQG